MKNLTFKITLAALFTAAALISFTIESLFPPIIIPGARLGVSNVFILLAVIILGPQYGFISLIIKCLLGSLFAGNFSAVIYSLPAGLISLSVQTVLLVFSKKFSVVSVSVAGGTLNLTVQNVIFCLVAGGSEYFAYLPYLAVIGAASGAFVGFTVYLLVKILPEKYLRKKQNI
ncbi:MAG: Gx transporter family protein [Clostridia bacterium]|nr:Gx transporter family protein [Clostridia bacterium]